MYQKTQMLKYDLEKDAHTISSWRAESSFKEFDNLSRTYCQWSIGTHCPELEWKDRIFVSGDGNLVLTRSWMDEKYNLYSISFVMLVDDALAPDEA